MTASLTCIDVARGLWIISGSALDLSRHPHWYVRGWDSPREIEETQKEQERKGEAR